MKFISNVMEIITAVNERFVPYMTILAEDISYVTEKSDFTQITTINGRVRFTFNNDYYIFAWIENGELHLESEYGDDIFDSAGYYGWDDKIVEYIKYGVKIV